MTTELEAILLGESLHLRDDHRLSTGASQASQVGVVDNALPWRIPPVGQGFMKKALHLETIEGSGKTSGSAVWSSAGKERWPRLSGFAAPA